MDDSELYYGYSKNSLLIMDHILSTVKPKDMTDSEFLAICAIRRRGRMALTEIADAMDSSLSNMTRTSVSLESRGLVSRIVSSSDRRRVELELTEEGSRVADDLSSRMSMVFEFCMMDLSDEERIALRRMNGIIGRTASEADSRLGS